MKHIVIAPVGDNLDALFIGIKEFPTERIFLVTPKERADAAQKAKKDLERFKIPVTLLHISENLMEDMFKIFAEVKKLEPEKSIVVNVATGDHMSACIALSAAFVHGFKAFGVVDNQPILMPILKFSYYKLLTEKKIELLKVLEKNGSLTLRDLSGLLRVSLPLLSYHLNGTYKVEGLKELGLVEVAQKRGRLEIKLSQLGSLFVKGYIS